MNIAMGPQVPVYGFELRRPSGDPRYRAMVVSDYPPGEFLDTRLGLVGVDKDKVYITSNGNHPGVIAKEVTECNPKAILALGGDVTRVLTGYDGPMGEVQGKLIFTPKLNYPVVPCWHPKYVEKAPMKDSEFMDALLNWAALVRMKGKV